MDGAPTADSGEDASEAGEEAQADAGDGAAPDGFGDDGALEAGE